MNSFYFDNVRLAPDEQIGLHADGGWELSYILVGSGTRIIGHTSEPFAAGELILVPPHMSHCWLFDASDTDDSGCIANITVGFEESFLDRCTELFPELASSLSRFKEKRNAVKFDPATTALVLPLLKEMCLQSEAHRLVSFLRLLLLLTEDERATVLAASRRESKEQQRLQRVRTYVVCNAVRGITLADVARHVGMSRVAFCTFFKRTTGKTFIAYFNEHRLQLACRLLKDENLSISEVCYRAGFNNVPYFNRLFRRVLGTTPKAWRRGE